MDLLWIIGSVAWWSTALVHKNGPFDVFLKFREWSFRVWGQKDDRQLSPLICTFCTGIWVLFPILIVSTFLPSVIQFFGILGLAAAVRGMSQEY